MKMRLLKKKNSSISEKLKIQKGMAKESPSKIKPFFRENGSMGKRK